MDPHSSPVVRTVIVEQTPQVAPAARVSKPLDPSRFVVLGEGLAAGMTNFSLMDCDQRESFGAQMARQMNVAFAQPLIQPPGLGDAPGFPRLPVRLPFDHQTTVLTEFPPSAPYGNLSVPGLTLADAVGRRPMSPKPSPGIASPSSPLRRRSLICSSLRTSRATSPHCESSPTAPSPCPRAYWLD